MLLFTFMNITISTLKSVDSSGHKNRKQRARWSVSNLHFSELFVFHFFGPCQTSLTTSLTTSSSNLYFTQLYILTIFLDNRSSCEKAISSSDLRIFKTHYSKVQQSMILHLVWACRISVKSLYCWLKSLFFQIF